MASNSTSSLSSMKIASYKKLKKSFVVRTQNVSAPRTVHVQIPDKSPMSVEVQWRDTDTIGYIKDKIEEKMNIPREHLKLKLAAKPDIILVDNCKIYEYNKWNLSVLDMVLEIIPGDCYIRVLQLSGRRNDRQFAVQEYYTGNTSSFVMKVNNSDTIKTVKDQIMATNPEGLCSAFKEKLFYKSMNMNILNSDSIGN